MAANSTTERTVKTKFDGDSKGVQRAAREAERELERLRKVAEREQAAFVKQTTAGADKVVAGLSKMVAGVLAVGSAASSAQGLAGAAVAIGAMSGALLAVPGVALSGAAAIGVLKLATSGFADAVAADDVEAWTEATKNMAPAAVKTAQAVRDQNTRFTELKKTVQGRFFEGFDSDVRALADRYFPMLIDQGGEIAGGWNKMGRAAAQALLAPGAVSDVNDILGSTKDTMKELEPAAGNVLTALLDLGGVGAKRATSLGKAVTDVTQRFEDWVAEGVKTGKINDLIDEGIDTAKDFGRVLQNVGQIGGKLWTQLNAGEQDFLDGIIETTQAVEDFLDSAEGQEAIRALADTLGVAADVARDVFATAMREIAPIVRDAAPAVQEFARGVGEFLTNAIETVGPLLHGLVQFLSDNKEVVGDLVPVILGLAVAYKGLKVATDVKTWMAGIPGLFDDIGKKADAAGAAIGDEKNKGGLVGRLGGLKAIAGTVALGAVAKGLDEVNTSAAGSEEKLGPVEDTLHNIVSAGEALLALDFGGIFKDMASEWDLLVGKFKTGESPLGKLLVGEQGKIDLDVSVKADTAAAKFDTEQLIGEIDRSEAKVNIDGNDVPAGRALRRVLDAILAGEEYVTINGSPVRAQRALDDTVRLINESSGTVRLDGNDVPAGEALLALLNRISSSNAVVSVSANTSNAQGVIDSFIRMNDGREIRIFTSSLGSGGLASAGRLATGGPVRGPGTGTSDTAGLFALSNGEHVLTDAEVRAAGGHDAIFRLRRALTSGRITKLATGGPAVPSYLGSSIPMPRSSAPTVSVGAPSVGVTVLIDGREVRGIVRTEIEQDKKEQRRVARTGSGGAW